MYKNLLKTLLLGSVVMPAGAAVAQEQSQPLGGLSEILVTASRTSENIQKTPIAVSAFTAEALEERQITGVRDVSAQIPGLLIQPITSTSASARIVLRGVGQENSGVLFDPSVGIYIDGVYEPRVNAFFDFADVERIEVLRGPQGTLYGRNSSGGALKIITKRPSDVLTYKADIGVGSYNQLEFQGYVSGPIIEDKLAGSISYADRRRDGLMKAPAYGRKVGDSDSSTLRGKLLFTPTERLTIELGADYITDRGDPGVGSPIQVRPDVNNPKATLDRDIFETELSGPIDSFVDTVGTRLNVNYELSDNLTLSAISGYRWMNMSNVTTFGMTTSGQDLGADWEATNKNFSQEVTLTYESDRFRGVAGLYYFTEKGEMERGILGRDASIGAANYNASSLVVRRTDAYAGFFDGKVNLTDSFAVIGGLRYTREKADLTQSYPANTTNIQREKETFTAWTPKIGIDWQINDDILVYASYTKGFKSGGFNTISPSSLPNNAGRPTVYDPEKVDSYEAGIKFTTPDRTFRLNAAVFNAEYSGVHLPVFFPGTAVSYVSNATGARIWGIELEPTWKPSDLVEVYGALSFTRGKYTDSYICTNGYGVRIECGDKDIKGLIPEQATIGAALTPSYSWGDMRFNLEWQYTSAYMNNASNHVAIGQAQKSSLFNASARWISPDGHWNIALEGQNIFDKTYYRNAMQISHPTQPTVLVYPGAPRTLTLRAGFNF